MRRWALGAALGTTVAAAAYWRRALTLDGALAAAVMGWIVLGRGGWGAAATLLAFFLPTSLLSRIGHARKAAAPLAQEKGTRRDAWQVAANGGVAAVALIGGGGGPVGRAAFAGALAAAASDTWATELGMLASGSPRLITTGARVPRGTSGGVTPRGLLSSAAGAAVVAVTWRACGQRAPAPSGIVAAGLAGSFVDSVLGATVQASYICPICQQETESRQHGGCGSPTVLRRGFRWATNDTINAAATLTGALVAAAWTSVGARSKSLQNVR